jgi:hypothetical protein
MCSKLQLACYRICFVSIANVKLAALPHHPIQHDHITIPHYPTLLIVNRSRSIPRFIIPLFNTSNCLLLSAVPVSIANVKMAALPHHAIHHDHITIPHHPTLLLVNRSRSTPWYIIPLFNASNFLLSSYVLCIGRER